MDNKNKRVSSMGAWSTVSRNTMAARTIRQPILPSPSPSSSSSSTRPTHTSSGSEKKSTAPFATPIPPYSKNSPSPSYVRSQNASKRQPQPQPQHQHQHQHQHPHQKVQPSSLLLKKKVNVNRSSSQSESQSQQKQPITIQKRDKNMAPSNAKYYHMRQGNVVSNSNNYVDKVNQFKATAIRWPSLNTSKPTTLTKATNSSPSNTTGGLNTKTAPNMTAPKILSSTIPNAPTPSIKPSTSTQFTSIRKNPPSNLPTTSNWGIEANAKPKPPPSIKNATVNAGANSNANVTTKANRTTAGTTPYPPPTAILTKNKPSNKPAPSQSKLKTPNQNKKQTRHASTSTLADIMIMKKNQNNNTMQSKSKQTLAAASTTTAKPRSVNKSCNNSPQKPNVLKHPSLSKLTISKTPTSKISVTKGGMTATKLTSPLPPPPPPQPLLDPRLDFFHGKAMLNTKPNHLNSSKVKNNNNTINNSITPTIAKGKQRVKPRKKKLSTLKKKVLQERLRQWKELHGETVATTTNLEESSKTDNKSNPQTIVCLSNFVHPDELVDDDEYEEIVTDLTDLSNKISLKSEVNVPRPSNDDGADDNTNITNNNYVGSAFVKFQNHEDARAAMECWHNMLLGGNRIQTMLVDSYDVKVNDNKDHHSQSHHNNIPSEHGASNSDIALGTKVVLKNILTDDDLDDEECLEECKEDIQTLASQYGKVRDLKVELEGPNKGLVYVTYDNDESEVGEKAVKGLNGMPIGGQMISASICAIIPNRTTLSDKNYSVIELNNVLTDDDYTDDDCFEETKEDIVLLLEKYGAIQNITIERSGPNKGIILATFHGGKEIAEAAVQNLNGMLLGGQKVNARMKSQQMGQNEASIDESPERNGTTIILNNVLNEDDFDDDDCFEETKTDIHSMMASYGQIKIFKIERSGAQKGMIFVTYNENEETINQVVNELHGKNIGGNQISAKIMKSQITNKNETKTEHQLHDNDNDNDDDGGGGGGGDNSQNLEISKVDNENKENDDNSKTPSSIPPMYSGDKIIPPRYAECKLVPKIPNSPTPREYASRIPDESAVSLLVEMLGELMKFQLRSKDDANARARRRLVLGLREVARGIRSHKVKMVIMANNLDTYGAIDAKLEEILKLAKEEDVPVLFEFNKRKLGKALGKSIKVAVVGVQNADGAYEQFKKLKKLYNLPRVKT